MARRNLSSSPRFPRRQAGVALVIALLILLVISIIGVVALRTSAFNAKISTSARGSALSFQAAESALAALFLEAADQSDADPGNVINVAIGQLGLGAITPVDRCVTKNDLHKPFACTAADSIDDRGLLQASSRLVVKPNPVLSPPTATDAGGDQISRAGEGSTIFADYEFVGVGRGSLDALNIENFNVQEFAQRGIVPGDDF